MTIRAITTPETVAASSFVTTVSPILNASSSPHFPPWVTTFPSNEIFYYGRSLSSEGTKAAVTSFGSAYSPPVSSVDGSVKVSSLVIVVQVVSSAGAGFVFE